MRYGYGGSSPWSALGQGLANGYLLRLQQQMQQQAMMQKLAMERQEQERAAASDATGLEELAGIIQASMPPKITAGAPMTGAEGLRPAGEQEGFGQPEAFQQQPLDIPALIRAGGRSATASKLKQDPQFYQLLQAGGAMPHPDVVKQQQIRDDLRREADASPEVNGILAEMFPNMTPEKMAALRGAVPNWKDLMASGRLAQGTEGLDLRAQNLDLSKQLFELRKLMEAGGTVKSAAEIANTRAGTSVKTEHAAKLRKEIPLIGTAKAGKPSESDKRVATWVENYKYGEEFADRPEKKGALSNFGISYGSKPSKSRRDLAWADVERAPLGSIRDIKQRAFQAAFGDPADHVPATDEDESGPVEAPARPSPATLPSRSALKQTRPMSKTATDFFKKYGGQ